MNKGRFEIAPIMTIGLTGEDEDFYIKYQLKSLEKYDLLEKFDKGNILEFDMMKYPERGDALDILEKMNPGDVSLVVALHLFGIEYAHVENTEGRYYNKRNHELLKICEKLKVPLLVFGDRPKGRRPDEVTGGDWAWYESRSL